MAIDVADSANAVERSYEETVFEMEQRFEALPEDPALQAHTEQVLRGILGRAPGSVAPIEGPTRRGSTCRAAYHFETLEEAQATLDTLPEDEDWKREKLGFNAVPVTAEDEDALAFVVYFTAQQTSEQ